MDNCGEQRWNHFWKRQHSHTRHSGALSRVSVFDSLNCIWLWIIFCTWHQEYLHILFDTPGEWERISNCLNEIQVRGLSNYFPFLIGHLFSYRFRRSQKNVIFFPRKPRNSSSTVRTTRWKILRTLPFSPSIMRWCSCHRHLSSLMI